MYCRKFIICFTRRSFLGTPCVNIGTRQSGRERAANVIGVKCDANEIKTAIDNQLKHGRYESSHLVGDGTAGTQIANILATSNLKFKTDFLCL